MEYEGWYNSFVDEDTGKNPTAMQSKMNIRSSSDKKQFEHYKSVLGRTNVSKPFEALQEPKYNNIAR